MIGRRHGLAIQLAIDGEPGLALVEKEALYRIAQEALHNIAKHAHATSVIVSLREQADRIELEVSDDGCGFDPTQPYAGHLGLRSMRERAARLGGGLEISSGVGAGSRVSAWLPLGPAT
jgi:signal transduction histidine kinase